MRIIQSTGHWKPTARILRCVINDRLFPLVEKKWRRGQDSNLHILSDGGFQDLKVALNLTLRLSIYQYKPG